MNGLKTVSATSDGRMSFNGVAYTDLADLADAIRSESELLKVKLNHLEYDLSQINRKQRGRLVASEALRGVTVELNVKEGQ